MGLILLGALGGSMLLAALIYISSVRPAVRAGRLGPKIYRRCAAERLVSVFFVLASMGLAIGFHWTAPSLPWPSNLPWPWPFSLAFGLLFSLSGLALIILGLQAAGKETWSPGSEVKLFGGIYHFLRHPQSQGAWIFGLGSALLIHDLTLTLLALGAFPLWWAVCRIEERDLLLRLGPVYEVYRKKTGAWWPRRGKGK